MPPKQDLVKSFILLGLSGYFLSLVLSGTLKNYINTDFAWLSLLAAVLFFILGSANVIALFIAYAARNGRDHAYAHNHDHDHDHDHEHHGHSHGGRAHWIAIGFALIPLLLGFAVPSQPLSANALDTNLAGSSSVSDSTSNSTQPPIDKSLIGTAADVSLTEWHLYDWQQAFRSGDYAQTWFNGQSADVIGMVVRPGDLPAGHFVVGRWVMRHCAADAFGVGLLVKSDRAESLPLETWVRVKGKTRVGEFNGEPVLMLDAVSIDDTISEPAVPYIFPRRVQPKK